MNSELFQQIIDTYRRHGWELQTALLKPETRKALASQTRELFADAELREDEIDALWFARPSHAGREAWELRLVAEQPYALFETFAAEEPEIEQKEKRAQMESRMREHAAS